MKIGLFMPFFVGFIFGKTDDDCAFPRICLFGMVCLVFGKGDAKGCPYLVDRGVQLVAVTKGRGITSTQPKNIQKDAAYIILYYT